MSSNATMTSQQQSSQERASSQPTQTPQATSNMHQQFRNPFSTSGASPDPDASFHHEPETWHFNGHRKASVPATDVGEQPRHTSVDDQELFETLMKETKGMSEEQVKEYLSKRPQIDGAKIMRGKIGLLGYSRGRCNGDRM
jgi:hypothetical protein